MSFTFGSNTSQNAFGAAIKPSFSFGGTATTTAGFGGFGTTTTAAPTFGGFGTTTTAATPFGTLGATTTTTSSMFGAGAFGSTAAKPAFGTAGFGTGTTFGTGSAFGAPAPAFGSTTNTFGTGTAPTFGAGTAPAFGASTAPTFGTGTAFGTNTFGVKPATTGFGFGTTGLNAFGQPQQQQLQQQQQQQQQGPASAHEALMAAIFNCVVFGDERDQVLAKWNLLQARWGTGKAYYSSNAQPLELNEQNPHCRFKAVGYSRLGGREDKDGHVALLFNKADSDIKNNQQAMTSSILGLLGNKPNFVCNIESIKAVSENKTQLVIYIVDNNASGSRVLASELSAFLNSPSPKAALTGGGCVSVAPITRPPQHALSQYLETPPPGMDIRLWKQAQADNPDPENYIPVSIIGFSEIKFRARCQAEQASLQANWLKKADEHLAELRTRRAASAAKLANLTAKFHAMRHTLLQVLGNQEVRSRIGIALSPEEEAARTRLQELVSQLAARPLYNGRLNELLCAVRLKRSSRTGTSHERYQLDPGAQEDVRQFLTLQTRGTQHLLDTARRDLAALNTISDGLSRLVRG